MADKACESAGSQRVRATGRRYESSRRCVTEDAAKADDEEVSVWYRVKVQSGQRFSPLERTVGRRTYFYSPLERRWQRLKLKLRRTEDEWSKEFLLVCLFKTIKEFGLNVVWHISAITETYLPLPITTQNCRFNSFNFDYKLQHRKIGGYTLLTRIGKCHE